MRPADEDVRRSARDAETERLAIVEAAEPDIGWIVAQENDEENRRFIWPALRRAPADCQSLTPAAGHPEEGWR